jgi:hypothetical protein
LPRPLASTWGRAASIVVSLALLNSGCAVAPPVAAPDFGAWRDFLVDDAGPLEARGVVSFTYRGETQSGEVFVRCGPGSATLLQLRARVTGTLALEVRWDERRLLVLDYIHQTYYQGDNTPDTREELFGLDVTPAEFRTILTGRIVRREFEAGRGTLLGVHEVAYRRGGDRYIFTLGEDGLPLSWVKQHEHTLKFRVEYRGYTQLPARREPPVRMPERLRVYVDGSAPRMVLGVREYSLPAAVPPLSFDLPPDAASFQPQ